MKFRKIYIIVHLCLFNRLKSFACFKSKTKF